MKHTQLAGWLLALCALALPPCALAQGAAPASTAPAATSWYQGGLNSLQLLTLVPGSWSGSLGLTYMHGEQTSTSDTASSGSKTNAYGETLTVTNSGFYVLSPLLFSGSLGLALGLNQDKSAGTDTDAASSGKVLGYSFDGTFLAEKPYPVNVAAHRNQVQLVQTYGARVVGTNENRRIVFSLHPDSVLNDMGYPWTEGMLELSQDKTQTTTTSYGRTLVTDEQGRALSLRASKGFETADLIFNYNANNRQSMTQGSADAQSQLAQLTYSLDFGPTLNRRLDTRFMYQSRSGAPDSEMLSGSGSLQVAHSQKLSTDYSYDITQMTAGNSTSKSQNVAAGVAHELYKNLATNARVNASTSQMTGGETRSYSGQLGQSYRHSLPGDGNFNANWSAGYQMNRNALDSGDIPVFNEAHLAPRPLALGAGFDLKQRFVIRSSIKVFNSGNTLLVEDADYKITTSLVDSKMLRIEPLPTSLVVTPGEALSINYTYQVDPNLASRTESRGYGFGVDYKWINLTFGESQSQETPIEQSEKSTNNQFLQSSEQKFVQVGTQGEIWGIAANSSVNYAINHAVNDVNNDLKFTSELAWDLDVDTQASVMLQANQMRYTLPDVRTARGLSVQASFRQPERSLAVAVSSRNTAYTSPTIYSDAFLSASSTFNWYSDSGWRHSAGLEWSKHQQRNDPAELLMQIRAQSDVTLGKLSLSVNGAYGQWVRGNQRSTNKSLNLSALRQF
ncbi:MAG: hypothetical protein COW02_17980 [Comamonadaceae bacterium CG12_big_fil_rev_8_21_14_0_65_59_15]|nr:MAG: hypothetical protein COW02_17980 [Comamonadaceae bacterium CG12_big_fil_rev_8_21_14_0_65_59_15]